MEAVSHLYMSGLSYGQAVPQRREVIDLGWSSSSSGELDCQLRLAPAPLPPLARFCCSGAKAAPMTWRAARVAVLGPLYGGGQGRVLRSTCGEAVVMRFTFGKITGLRRVDDPELPGLDITVLGRSQPLQLRAASSGMEAWRFELLHAYLAAAVEEGRTRGITTCVPEWPRKAGLAQLAAKLKGATLCKAHEVETLERFAGPRCPICLEAWPEAEDRDVVTLPCGHAFCQLCLGESTLRSARCPSCRTSFEPTERPGCPQGTGP